MEFEFTVKVVGIGDTEAEAWQDAKESITNSNLEYNDAVNITSQDDNS